MEVIKGLLKSKKFVASAAGMFISIAVTLGLDPAAAEAIVAVVVKCTLGFVVGQGVADLGKEKAKIEADAAPATPTVVAAASVPSPG